MDIYSLSRKWKELVDKARAKQLSPQEYTTGLCYHRICVIHGVIHSTVAILLQQWQDSPEGLLMQKSQFMFYPQGGMLTFFWLGS